MLEVSKVILQAHRPGELLDLDLEGLTGIKGVGREKGPGWWPALSLQDVR